MMYGKSSSTGRRVHRAKERLMGDAGPGDAIKGGRPYEKRRMLGGCSLEVATGMNWTQFILR